MIRAFAVSLTFLYYVTFGIPLRHHAFSPESVTDYFSSSDDNDPMHGIFPNQNLKLTQWDVGNREFKRQSRRGFASYDELFSKFELPQPEFLG
ncbi:hypothetical protein AAHC03_01325 [Spirometra sp. Aus1]